MEQMARIILRMNEPDRPDVQEKLQEEKQSYDEWDKYKVRLVAGFRKELRHEKFKNAVSY